MIDIIVIFLSVLIGLAIILFTLKLISSRTHKKLIKVIEKRFANEKIIFSTTSANFFGVKSEGVSQAKGNGALILTSEALQYIRAVPERKYIIPLNRITEITLPTSFNGRSIFAQLLCVEFESEKGEDALGWAVKDPEIWKNAIEQTKQLKK